jgi:hypothetical protein
MNKQTSLMKCGCSASSKIKIDGCWVDACGTHNCTEKVENPPSLNGRKAKCGYGDTVVNSNYNLAFFKHSPNEEYDTFYCGCYGWD